MKNSANRRSPEGARKTVYGIIAIVLGILAVLSPGFTGQSIFVILGVIVSVAGIVRILWAVQAANFGMGMTGFIVGGLTLLCGIALITNPLLASKILTILVAVYFIIDGILEFAAGIRRRPIKGSTLLLVTGAISVVLGVIIWLQYPVAGAWALGILLGIKLIMIGMNMLSGRPSVSAAAEL